MSWQASHSNGASNVKYGSYVLGQGLSKSLLADRYQDGSGRAGARGDNADDWRLPQMSSPRMRLLAPRNEESASYRPADPSSVRLPAPRRAVPDAEGMHQPAPPKRRAKGADDGSRTQWPVWHLRVDPGQSDSVPSSTSHTAEPPSTPRDHPPRPSAGTGATASSRSQEIAASQSPSKGTFTEGDLRRRQRDRQCRRRANASSTIQAYLRTAALHSSFVEVMQQRHGAARKIQRQWDRHKGTKEVQLKKQAARQVHNAAARIQATWRGLTARRSLGLAQVPSKPASKSVAPLDEAAVQEETPPGKCAEYLATEAPRQSDHFVQEPDDEDGVRVADEAASLEEPQDERRDLEEESALKALEILTQNAINGALAKQVAMLDHEKSSASAVQQDLLIGDARRPSLGEEIAADAAAELLRSALEEAPDANSSRRSSSASNASVAIPETCGSGIMNAALAGLLVEHDLELHKDDSSNEGDPWNILDLFSVPDSSAVSCELVDSGE
mmetsp:Transcript_57816/g.106842  ORF Transcript_57816/g.106842 Transcript_57816/m.106842 type:complete len:500 (+) Transcript_57816:79-1578(+)